MHYIMQQIELYRFLLMTLPKWGRKALPLATIPVPQFVVYLVNHLPNFIYIFHPILWCIPLTSWSKLCADLPISIPTLSWCIQSTNWYAQMYLFSTLPWRCVVYPTAQILPEYISCVWCIPSRILEPLVSLIPLTSCPDIPIETVTCMVYRVNDCSDCIYLQR